MRVLSQLLPSLALASLALLWWPVLAQVAPRAALAAQVQLGTTEEPDHHAVAHDWRWYERSTGRRVPVEPADHARARGADIALIALAPWGLSALAILLLPSWRGPPLPPRREAALVGCSWLVFLLIGLRCCAHVWQRPWLSLTSAGPASVAGTVAVAVTVLVLAWRLHFRGRHATAD